MFTKCSGAPHRWQRERQDSRDAIGEEQDVGELADAAVEEEMR